MIALERSGERIIYDIGANTGQDIEYYLLKADRVIAVEADPSLCATLAERWADAVSAGRLVVVNVVVTGEEEEDGEVDFHLHRHDHQLSQFPEPLYRPEDFARVRLPALPMRELLARYGEPHYVKTDVENYDAKLLEALFAGGFRPEFVSAEYHSMKVFDALVGAGYGAFCLVDAAEVPRRFNAHRIKTLSGEVRSHRFELHSSGPFGEDLPGPWYDRAGFVRLLSMADLSWADIHATRLDRVTLARPPGRAMMAARRWLRRAARRLEAIGAR